MALKRCFETLAVAKEALQQMPPVPAEHLLSGREDSSSATLLLSLAW